MTEMNLVKDALTKENKVWIRISSACNAHCMFCLDSQSHLGKFTDEADVKKQIKEQFKKDQRNRVILSGGEASINPKFPDYIAYAKEVGYDRIQTVTNGMMFGDQKFVDKCIKEGLQEITFSMHGHTEKLHDFLVATKGAFKKALSGIEYIREKYPEIIVNIDVCVNKINYKYLADIIKFFIQKNVQEFDILQIIPFGEAVGKHKKHLFYDIDEAYPYLQKAWVLKNLPGVVMFTNRFPVESLENNEDLIQNHNKIAGEILGEARKSFQKVVDTSSSMYCRGENCKYCFLNQFCDILHDHVNGKKHKEQEEKRIVLNSKSLDALSAEKIYELKGFKMLSDVKKTFGETSKDFIKNIKKLEEMQIQTLNIPKCLNKHNLGFTSLSDCEGDNTNIKYFVDSYIENLYRKKSLRCKECKYFKECEGIHISYICSYGFKILSPIC